MHDHETTGFDRASKTSYQDLTIIFVLCNIEHFFHIEGVLIFTLFLTIAPFPDQASRFRQSGICNYPPS